MRIPPLTSTVSVLVALLVAACSAGPEAGGTTLPEAFADGVPDPTGEVVLTLDVGGDLVDWDLATLAQLEQEELALFEPFVEEDRVFTGPWFADVLLASGADPEAVGEVELVALDDFKATIPTGPGALDGAMLATLDGGAAIPLADGGPIRLVFAADNPTGDNLNAWIWSMRSGVVR